MENAIKFLRIQNFKSIKDVTLHPRRVNLIIGEPNVGKSNLLEAMTLLGGITYEQTEKFMGSFIRYEEPRQLFYDNLVGNTIKVETDRDVAVLVYENKKKLFGYFFINATFYNQLSNDIDLDQRHAFTGNHDADMFKFFPNEQQEINNEQFDIYNIYRCIYGHFDAKSVINYNGEPGIYQHWGSYDAPPKAYTFRKASPINQDFGDVYLNPPYGDNLVDVIRIQPQFYQEIGRMFAHYNQELQLRGDTHQLDVVKKVNGIVYSYPYSSVADTLQRIIFYLAAIESNDDAVLLFEEPEAHSFPVYVSKLGRRVVESRNNQFFIDTHSPYLITEILETMLTDDAQAGELAMFAAYYEDHQTKVHQLSDEEIRSIRADGIDVFYNMKRFTTGAASNA